MEEIRKLIVLSDGMATDPNDNRLYDIMRYGHYRPERSRAVRDLVRAVPELLAEVERLREQLREGVL